VEIAYVLIPLGLTAGIVLCGLLVVSSVAERAARGWQADKDVYRKVRSEIRKLKHTLQMVTVYEWPIWPRPVLYETIDRQTQLAFARAEDALAAIRQLDSHLNSVPTHSSAFSAVFNLTKNLAIRRQARANQAMLQDLRSQQQALSGYLGQIGRNLAEVARLQKQVEGDLTRFRQQYNEADMKYLGYLSNPDDPHFIEVSTIYHEVLACLVAAEEASQRPAAVDGMGYAAAHFWQQAAVVFQTSFDAACLVHTYSDAYLLDKTQQRMDAILNTLRSLDLAKQSQDWLPMAKAYRVIQHQKNSYAFVLKSISEFDSQHQQCLDYKKRIAALSLDELKAQAESAEAGLAEFLLPEQLPAFWPTLYSDGLAPSQKIQQVQAQLDAIHNVCTGGPILQSEIDQKMALITTFLAQYALDVNTIEQNIQAVLKATQNQKTAETQVLQKLAPTGETTRALMALDGVAKSSTDEILQKYLALQAAYQQFHSQAATRQGANYSSLLAGLTAFESECNVLIQEHMSGASTLQAQAAALQGRITALHSTAAALQTKAPLVDGTWEDIFQQFAAIEKQYPGSISAASSYVQLTEYQQQAAKTLAWLEEEVGKLNQIHQNFAIARINLNNHLSSAKKSVDSQIETLTSTWPLPMRDLLNEFKAYKNQYAGLRKAFLRLSDIQTMSEALLALDNLEKQIQQVEAQVREKIDLSVKQQKQLNDFVKQINSIIQNAQYLNTSIARVESAREIMQAAHEKETFADAYTLLKWAVSILQSSDSTTKQSPGAADHGPGKLNRPGSNRMITSDYKRDVPPEKPEE
jgi:predicted  nucleic acid-binding Zn-ribbon protein